MGLRVGRYLKRALAVIGFLLGLVVIGLIPVSLSPIRQPLRRFAQENLAPDLEIRGSFTLRLGPSPRVDAADIVIRAVGIVNEPPTPLVSGERVPYDILLNDVY